MEISLAQFATYFAYIFIIAIYTWKIVKIVRMPMHVRWELYPVPQEKNYTYGGSYYEVTEWWLKQPYKAKARSILLKMRDYLILPGYFRRNKSYWLGLYPWHLGFYLIITFHIISFFDALLMVTTGIAIAANSAILWGRILYYLTLVIGIGSFTLGSLGSIIMLGKRLLSPDLRTYATAANYFNYVFFLAVFLSGFLSWYIFDPTFSVYRSFWQSLITFKQGTVEAAAFTHIMLFAAFLIYLPFTRSTHYITKLIAYFGILWDDTPNEEGARFAGRLTTLLDQKVSWSAGHIQKGKTWREVASGPPSEGPKNG